MGKLARNVGIKLPGINGNYISTPYHASSDITGDLCLISHLKAVSWEMPSGGAIVGKWNLPSDRGYFLQINFNEAKPTLLLSEDGASFISNSCTERVPVLDMESIYLAVTYFKNFDTNIDKITFWYKLIANEDWRILGEELLVTAIDIYQPSIELAIGGLTGGTGNKLNGTIYSAQVYDGIGDNSQPGLGTLVAEFDAAKCKPRYRDGTGKIWTLNGSDSTMEKV